MNPYELADKLENATNISEVARLVKEEVIPMLRAKELTDEEIEAIRNREDLEYDNRFSLNFRTIKIKFSLLRSWIKVNMLAKEFLNYGKGWTKDHYVFCRLGCNCEFGIKTHS